MKKDSYKTFAQRYDWMFENLPERSGFFEVVFAKNGVQRVLDCACGTGNDLVLFHELGLDVTGSDASPAMLEQAAAKLAQRNLNVPLERADYRELEKHFDVRFDAVVCLTSAINEATRDDRTLAALRSMRGVLGDGGIMIFDQGIADAGIKEQPRFSPIVNTRDHSRLYTMTFDKGMLSIDVHDFTHSETHRSYDREHFELRVRTVDAWITLLRQAGFTSADVYGDWRLTPYDKEKSNRLIVVARR